MFATAGPAFIPSYFPKSLSPAAWYDFSDNSTLFQDTGAASPVTTTGQSIYYVKDKSGNGIDLKTDSGRAPTLQSISGYPAAQFSGSYLYSTTNPGFSLKTNEIVFLFSASVQHNNCGVVILAPSSGNDYTQTSGLALPTFDNSHSMHYYANSGAVNIILGSTSPAPLAVYSLVSSSSGSYTGRINNVGSGVTSNTSSLANAHTGPLVLGTRFISGACSTATNDLLSGNIYQVLIFNKNLSSSDRSALCTYVGNKAGLSV